MGPPFDDIGGLLDQMRREDPARPALSFYRGRELDGRMSYGELVARVEQLAGALRALGVGSGDRVAVLAPNRLEIPPLYLALWRLGAVVVPLNPGVPDEDWRQVMARSQACGLIATRELLATREPLAAGFARSLEDLAGGEKAPEVRALAAEPAIILYTSGTTASPKGVTLTQRNLICNAWSMARNFRLRHTTQLAVLPLFHAHALGFGMMSALTTGGHLVLVEKLDPFAWAEIIRAESVEFTSVVPSLLPLLLGARVTRKKVPSLRGLLVSSAPLARERARELEEQTGIPLIQGWGLSEYTNFACCVSPYDSRDEHERLLFGWETPSIGSALEGTEVMVMDAAGNPAPEEMRGELCVRGHSRMIGYFQDAEATRASLAGDWLRTGDEGLFRRRGDERVFFITGRIKELIIRNGEKYSPLGIERKLLAALPELDGKLMVLGFPHQLHGEEVGAYLELSTLPATLRARLEAAAAALAVECRPKIILHGAAPIPRTHTGKIQRKKLLPAFAAFESCRGKLRIVPFTAA